MLFLSKLFQFVLVAAVVTDLASASHLHRYHRHTRNTNTNSINVKDAGLQGLDILAKYICTPCPTTNKRQAPADGPALNIPTTDLPSVYTSLLALKTQTLNRMAAFGITPQKRSLLSLFLRSSVPDIVPVPATDFSALKTYVCPSSCVAKRQTTVTTEVSVVMDIDIDVPPDQLQGVLDAINRALKQLETLLRGLGLPIPEGALPSLDAPGGALSTTAAPEITPEISTGPAPAAPAPADPAPTYYTTRTTSTNTITVTETNGIVTTILITETPAPTATTETGQEDCPATITVESTTTIYEEGAEATSAPA